MPQALLNPVWVFMMAHGNSRKTAGGPEGEVKALPPVVMKRLTIGVRVVLGAVFLFSGVVKIVDPSAFAAIVTQYQILPRPLIVPGAVVFPWIEGLCGLALVSGRYEKGAALLVSLMMIVFIGLGFYNAYRGLNIACGCFSLSAREPSSVILNTLRNLAILAAGIWILRPPGRRRA